MSEPVQVRAGTKHIVVGWIGCCRCQINIHTAPALVKPKEQAFRFWIMGVEFDAHTVVMLPLSRGERFQSLVLNWMGPI